jgi:hypothetical protein
MAYDKIPGCTDCGRTAHGGRTIEPSITPENARYEVRRADKSIGKFNSAVAAATFMRGHPGATLHTVREP